MVRPIGPFPLAGAVALMLERESRFAENATFSRLRVNLFIPASGNRNSMKIPRLGQDADVARVAVLRRIAAG